MDRRELAAAFRTQADWCWKLGSPLYHDLMERAAADVEAGGECWTILEPHAADPGPAVLPLRFFGGVHRAVLEGRSPELAQYYPSVGGTPPDGNAVWKAFLKTAAQTQIPDSVQTNEVGRSSALLPGFMAIRRATDFPLRLLEIGASGGLNLRAEFPFEVAVRRGCDLSPVDISNKSGQLTLLSFIWPDQPKRIESMRQAIEVANRIPAIVEQADAVEWIERELAQPFPGHVTVVFHSIVMLYLSPGKRTRFAEILAEAGARATSEAPLAWLSMERAEKGNEAQTFVHLTLWPGGQRRLVATAGFHGQDVQLA